MDFIISVALCLFVGVILGWYLREWSAVRTVNKLLKKTDNSDKDTKNIVNVYVTEDKGHFYIYDSATDAFITQVKTKEEMFDYFEEKFPNKTVLMKKVHLDLFDAA